MLRPPPIPTLFPYTTLFRSQPNDFSTLKKHGLTCAMVSNPVVDPKGQRLGRIEKAWNRVEHHDKLVQRSEERRVGKECRCRLPPQDDIEKSREMAPNYYQKV